MPATTTRDGRGRFKPGCSGNPKGRPLGSQNKKTRLERALDDPEGDLKHAARELSRLVQRGQLPAIRVLLDRLDPKPKSAARTITIEIDESASLGERLTAVFNATVQGRINPEEALQLAQLLDRLIKTGEAGPRIADFPEYAGYRRWKDQQYAAEMRVAAEREAAAREQEIAAAREAEVRRVAEAEAEAEAEAAAAAVDAPPRDAVAPSPVAAAPVPERRRDPSEYALPYPPSEPDRLYSPSISRSWYGETRAAARARRRAAQEASPPGTRTAAG